MDNLKTEPNEISNEKDYLDMVNHLKGIYDQKEKELELLKEDLNVYKKLVMSCYGVIRLLDFNNDSIFFDNNDKDLMIELLRCYLSQFVEEKILLINDLD